MNWLAGIASVAGPRLGAAAMLGLVVAGQMTESLLLDHFGVLGMAQQVITPWRLLGVGLVIAGVGLTIACSR